MNLPHRFPFGAQLLTPALVVFRLWAPNCDTVFLVLEGEQPIAMNAVRAGWFEIEAVARAGSRYRFRMKDGSEVPDPASRQQASTDPWDGRGWSLVVDPDAYDWQHPDWRGRPWHEAVIYELHVGLCGGFAGVTAKLAALAELGITAVELMPIAQFPGTRNWGYDGVLPFAPASAYGTPQELKTLIDTAHGLGLMVLLDVVYNHFGPDGNFLHTYAADFFREDQQTAWGAAIDFRRRPVRDFFIENARYWLHEYRFDGLRFDAVHAIGDSDYLLELAREARAGAAEGRHIHLVLENEDNNPRLLHGGLPATGDTRFDAQWNDDGHHCLHVLLTGEQEGYYEDYAEAPAEKLARCLAEGFVYQGEVSPHSGNARGEPSAALPSTAFVLFLQNHDHIGNRALGERLLRLCPATAFRAAAALVLLSPQIPLIFMGDEDGAQEPFLFFTDHEAELATLIREGRQNEFAKFAAFSGAGADSLPDPNEETTFVASVPKARSDSAVWRAFHRSLLALRREQIVPGLATHSEREAQVLGRAAVSVCWRSGGGVLRLVSNLDREPVVFKPQAHAELLYASDADAPSACDTWLVPGFCTLLFREQDAAASSTAPT